MTCEKIGSFQAKTHFAELLVAVEGGESITVTRRGKPVAILSPVSSNSLSDRQRAAAEIREARKNYRLCGLDLKALRDEGRK